MDDLRPAMEVVQGTLLHMQDFAAKHTLSLANTFQ